MTATNTVSTKTAATAAGLAVLLKSRAIATASSQIGKSRERVGARRLGAPKFVMASRVPRRSNSFVKPAMPKTTLSANRMKKIAKNMFKCVNISPRRGETYGSLRGDKQIGSSLLRLVVLFITFFSPLVTNCFVCSPLGNMRSSLETLHPNCLWIVFGLSNSETVLTNSSAYRSTHGYQI